MARSGGRRRRAALSALLLWALAPAVRADDDPDLGGFEVDEEFDAEVDTSEPLVTERWWDIDGSLALSTSWNYLAHRSVAPRPDGAPYTGLSRLRTRLNLQLDFELPRDFEVRLSPYVWYDFSYIIRGISKFTDQVIDDYEWEFDFQDSYIQGPLHESLDVKIGRQVVNWGRSDSVRVLDILNPLDNREPGRADIEDLRWAVAMAKLDYYRGPWTFTAVAIPEMRFDDLPPVGSDFNPLPLNPIRTKRPNSFKNWEFAGRIDGIFEGWDFSVQGAWFFEDIPRLHCPTSSCGLDPRPDVLFEVLLEHERLTMVGAGANYTFGSWLVKGEIAWLDGFRYTTCEPQPCDPVFGGSRFLTDADGSWRLDAMLGLEYYGISETTIAVEVVNRYLDDHDNLVLSFPTLLRENSTTYAIRWTADWLNARLQTTVLALLFGYKVQDGVVLRFQGAYTLRDGLVVTAGMLIFEGGKLPPLDSYDSNDRVFVDIKWSF